MKTLTPFTDTTQTRNIQMKAGLQLINPTKLLLEFEIQGKLENILWPSIKTQDLRQDNLWKHTCFEAFLGQEGQDEAPYLEFNASPSGEWNAYAFNSYRSGMLPAPHINIQLRDIKRSENTCRLLIEINSEAPLKLKHVGLSSVLEFTDNEISYWALSHPGPQADFHNKNGWLDVSTH